ncbi:hypothetical protein PENPOL_c006G10737 [Penicillium polonicum]|uniref:Beta-ketoacyl synthase-like N-terminal domain-containing protein n=1 Tax=Penicillium polonicum TaxID=60169 RepID=A0A1V6NLR9_PENPO|nr:hypothetical protein PENPOL_c006G10737 [Penicillium polonicum]
MDKNAKQHEDLERIVNSISPEAYISVLFDEARSTVTISERAAARFIRTAYTAGVVLSDTGFRGELRSPKAPIDVCHRLAYSLGSRAVHFTDVYKQPSIPDDDSIEDDNDTILLRKGTSQHEKVTPERLNFDSLFRKPNARDYFCNFVRDVDAFDNKFFKRSPRESAAMDPQHCLPL